jgi:hypothetical protein
MHYPLVTLPQYELIITYGVVSRPGNLTPVEPPLLFDLLYTHVQFLHGPSETLLILFLDYPAATAYVTNE